MLQLLKEYNYVPNETARGLVTQSSRLVGILISDIRTTHHADGVYYIERELTRQRRWAEPLLLICRILRWSSGIFSCCSPGSM